MSDLLRRLTALAILLAILAAGWSRLYDGPHGGDLLLLAILASLPALGGLLGRAPRAGVAAGTLAAVVGVGAAVAGVSPTALLTLSGDAWGAVASVLPDGLRVAESTSVPASARTEGAFVALLDLAYAAMAAGIAWQLVTRRRAGAPVVLAGLGLAYSWTVLPPDAPLRAGIVALAAMLAALALAGRAPGRTARGGWGVRAVALTGAALVAATVVAPGASSDSPWWNWRDWSVSGTQRTAAGLDIRQNYGRLEWAETPRTVMRVASPQRLPMRAAVLDAFDGAAFTTDDAVGSTPLLVAGGAILVEGADPSGTGLVEQRVRVVGLESNLVPLGGAPVRIDGGFSGSADLRAGGTVRVEPSLGPGDGYVATVRVPDPDPEALVAATAYGPGDAVPDEGLTVRSGVGAAGVRIPLWGTPATQPDDAELGPYAAIRDEARRVAGDARSPYVAVNRIEASLRGSGYAYDEAPPFPTDGTPPLVDFMTNTRRGFCQHFAGSMALMLRTLGIPSRVAVGYTAGTQDPESGDWTIRDRDAHSWVQVLLPGAGWVDFDPTPGRAVANRASVSSPLYAPPEPADGNAAPEVAQAPVAPVEQPPPVARPEPAVPDAAPEDAPEAAPAAGPPLDPWALAALALAAALAAPGVARVARRALRRRRGDERARTLAAVRDVEDALRATGAAPPEAGDAAERAAWLRARTGIDARALYAAAATVRWSGAAPPAGTAARAWGEARRIRREARRRAGLGGRARGYLGLHGPRGTLDA